MINENYVGSIFTDATGIQTHNLKIFYTAQVTEYLPYTLSTLFDLIMYVDIPKFPFLFSARGNYTEDTAGWGLQFAKVTSGYCPENCQLCEVSFKCKTYKNGYYKYKDNTCIQSCDKPYQKLNGSYCYDFDDETPYSQYLTYDFINNTIDPEYYSSYKLISQNGKNFIKGSDIYYSYFNDIRIFGGSYIWSQAKFQRIHNNIFDPHHGLTIAFFILYGPAFPSDGLFIYTIENNPPVSKSVTSFYGLISEGVKYDKVYEKINHDTNTLTISWECFGPNNEPVKAYCGFYHYYIAVHKCQPYCLQCSDYSTCTQWNNDYDANVVKFSQAECLSNQYYDKDSVRCLDCPVSCLTCTSKIDCQTCQPNYIQTKLGCTCKINQYEDTNQCFDCPIECNQCLNLNNCLNCLITNNRVLKNQQCICIDGYYPLLQNPKCQKCHYFCNTCTGPTNNDCLTCNIIVNIENIGSTCKCPVGSYYQDIFKSCSQCHYSCQTCFQGTFDGCLTCDNTLNRILKGLKCECEPGYYELDSVCTNCPIIENVLLISCYKLCANSELLWHTNICASGFDLVSGECQPHCGDLQIVGYEQCDDNNSDLCYNCQFQCPAHCITCDQSTTLPCPDICGDGMITGMEECEDGNNIQYDGCFNCKYQCQSPCTKCIKGECFECLTRGWQIDLRVQPWQCTERCGDNLIVGKEQCEDGNQDDKDGCKDCKYFCRIGCSSCNYTTNICLSCELTGFIPEKYYCKNNCGDRLVVVDPYGFYSEECDDGNTIRYDGCNNDCKFECQISSICLSCKNNRCEICATGYYLSNQQICIPICGDQMIVVGEQCEDSFTLPYKGCQNCQKKCQTSCINCDNTGLGCKSCQIGYNIIDNQCYSICGDNIITEDEECDDGNLIVGDGCNQCYFSCPISCSICRQGVCYDCYEGYQYIKNSCVKIQNDYHDLRCDSSCLSCSIEGYGCLICQSGFENIDNKCYPICGDKLVVANQQCDDGNLTFEDGCHQCSFSCSISCIDCHQGICLNCSEQNFYYQHQCFELIENIYLKEDINFQFQDLVITQTFVENASETSIIQMKIFEFNQQDYNKIGQYIEIMNSGYPYLNLEINIKCSQNKKLESQFYNYNFQRGKDDQNIILSYQCHNTVNHMIKFSFRLQKIILKDEILIINISEDEFKLSNLFTNFRQRLLNIAFVDVQ